MTLIFLRPKHDIFCMIFHVIRIIYLEDNNSKLANLLLNIKIKDKEYIYIKENINICLLLIIRSRFFQLYSSDSLSNSSFYYFLDFFWATFITYFKYLILFSVSLYYYYYWFFSDRILFFL